METEFELIGDVPIGARAVVGMSGGVDSAVTAALLVRAGYDVVGVTLELNGPSAGPARAGSCCSGRDARDAAAVAAILGIPHYVIDYRTRFRESVIQPFADAYARGTTPVPCIACNETVKFTDLLELATELGGAFLATGHYARRVEGPDGPELHRAVDPERDQSYFLCRTTPDQLARLQFPLGGMRKLAIRRLAYDFSLPVAEKPDSQDICFVTSGRYADLVRRMRPDAAKPGEIVRSDGRVIGRHEGVIDFTVGQRRGLSIGGSAEPLYVLRTDPASCQVVVGTRAELGTSVVPLRGLQALDPTLLSADHRPVSVRLRSTQSPVSAFLSVDGQSAMLEFPVLLEGGAAAGQAAAIYDGTRVLGGAWIVRPAIDRAVPRAAAGLDSDAAIPDKARLSPAAG